MFLLYPLPELTCSSDDKTNLIQIHEHKTFKYFSVGSHQSDMD